MSNFQDIDNKLRKCRYCGVIKHFNDFNTQKNCKYGISWACKECEKYRKKQYKLNNKEKIKRSSKIYYEKKKQEISEYHKFWYKKNSENHKVVRDEYYKKNKKKVIKKAMSMQQKEENQTRTIG